MELDFPNINEIFNYYNAVFFTGPLAIISVFLLLFITLKYLKNDTEKDKTIFIAVMLFLIGFGHLLVYIGIIAALQFNNIRIEKIDGLIIEKFGSTDNMTIGSIRISNPTLIKK